METIQLPYVTAVSGSIHIGSLRLNSISMRDVPVITIDLSALSRGAGVSIDGIVGLDILRRFTVRLDFSSGSVRFGDAELIPSDGFSVALRSVDGIYFAPVNLEGHGADLLLDTGTNTSSVSSRAWSDITAQWKPPAMVDGVRSTGGAEAAKFVCIPRLEVGGAHSRDIALRVQPPTRSGLFSDEGFEGLLGTDVLRQFIVTLDLANSRMYLQNDPNDHMDPDRFSMIGIQFAKDTEGSFTIMAVWSPSPAASAGLKVGDTIIAVNEQDAHSMSLEDLSRQIHGRSGTQVQLAIISDGRRHDVLMATHDLLCPVEPVENH